MADDDVLAPGITQHGGAHLARSRAESSDIAYVLSGNLNRRSVQSVSNHP
jgi:hypothetical protein